MNIKKIIEDVRKKPEHIRERYVWIIVGICMLIVIGVWIISFKVSFKDSFNQGSSSELKDSIEKSKQSLDAISETNAPETK